MRRLRRVLTTLAVAALAGSPALTLPATPSAAATAGLVTVRTAPAVAGVALQLGAQVQRTDSAGSATFTTADLDGARAGVRLIGAAIDATTRVELLHVATDPNHAIGARLLVAELAVSRPVELRLLDRHGAPVDPSVVTGMTVRSSDGHAATVRPGTGPVWLPSAAADRSTPAPGDAKILSYRLEGVRAAHVPVALGEVRPLAPGDASWEIPLAGYPFNVTVHTTPAVASVRLRLDDQAVTTDATGAATFYTGSLTGVASRVRLASHETTPNIRVRLLHVANDGRHAIGTRRVVVGLGVRAAVLFSFVDVAGHRVTPDRISSVVLGGPFGRTRTVSARELGRPVWLDASRLSQTSPPKAHEVTYSVDTVRTLGTNAVFAGGQRFDPVKRSTWLVRLHLYRMKVQAADMVFGRHSSGAVVMTAPDGSRHTQRLHGGAVVFDQVPRGEYQLAIDSGVRRMVLPVRVARDQVVDAGVVSWLDVVALLTLALALAVSIVWLGLRARRRRAAQPPVHPSVSSTTAGRVGVFLAVAGLLGAAFAGAGATPAHATTSCRPPAIRTDVPPNPAGAPATALPIPVWGYYYIWYTATSWHRAKIDAPQLGCYDSDDVAVMRAHVRMAQAAGITGFLVSWKHTPTLDARLSALTRVARDEHFRLGIVYEALDFYRRPLPSQVVRRDLRWFAEAYGRNPVFAADGKPVAVWTGTEVFAAPVVSAIASAVRPELTLLASAKSVEDYERVAPYVDGDAYYWSSGDPAATSYPRRLGEMGAAVHARNGMWLAPAAPGFDARLLGGHRNIARKDGATLRLSLAAALASAPDALGIISWNEWSENTYVEPSFRYGTTDLAVLAETLHGRMPRTVETDSSDDIIGQGGWRAWHSLLVILGICLATVAAVEQRRRRALHREVDRALRSEYAQLANSSGGSPDRHRGDQNHP